MEIAVILLVGTTAFALARGGSFDALLDTRLRFLPLVFAAVAIQVYFVVAPPAWLTHTGAMLIYLSTQALTLGFIWFNRNLPGMWLVVAGLALNMTVIALNGAMPVSESASRVAGAEFLTDHRHVEHGLHLRNEVLDDSARLPLFSDVIPVPGIGQVVSAGDVLIGLGLITLIFVQSGATLRGRPATRPEVSEAS